MCRMDLAKNKHQRKGIRNSNQIRRGGNNRRLINVQFGLGASNATGIMSDTWSMALQPILLQFIHTPGAPDLTAELRGVSRLVMVFCSLGA